MERQLVLLGVQFRYPIWVLLQMVPFPESFLKAYSIGYTQKKGYPFGTIGVLFQMVPFP